MAAKAASLRDREAEAAVAERAKAEAVAGMQRAEALNTREALLCEMTVSDAISCASKSCPPPAA